MNKLIQEHKGRVVDALGDNILAGFGSVVDAVNCAIEIQRQLEERNAEFPHRRRMEFHKLGVFSLHGKPHRGSEAGGDRNRNVLK